LNPGEKIMTEVVGQDLAGEAGDGVYFEEKQNPIAQHLRKIGYTIPIHKKAEPLSEVDPEVGKAMDLIDKKTYSPRQTMKILGVLTRSALPKVSEKYGIKRWKLDTTTRYYAPHVNEVHEQRKVAQNELLERK